MDVSAILKKIDGCLANNSLKESEAVMREGIGQALREEDDNALLSLLNELIGFYRETSRVEESFALADQAKKLVKKMGIEGTIPYATTYLNIANAYRAGGKLEESLACYRITQEIYHQLLKPQDMLEASLQNNMSLLHQEMGDYNSARDCLLKALEIVGKNPGAYFETAVTYANLAATCLKRNEDEEAAGYFRKAIEIFESHGIEDAHYSAALSSLGTYHYKTGDYEGAARYFRKAMDCMRRSLGENEYYYRLEENLKACERASGRMTDGGTAADALPYEEAGKSFMTGIKLSRAFYEAYGRHMIHEKFPDYEDRIAVGLAGEGSDSFGWDDTFSADHDWGPDFCMWVTRQTYETIGKSLQEEYEKLPRQFMGYTRTVSPQGAGRRGVQVIEDFFTRLLGEEGWQEILSSSPWEREVQEEVCLSAKELYVWQQIPDSGLAASVNGEVFCDGEGIFTKIRDFLKRGYPQQVLFLKLAQSAAVFSQTGQYNFGRMSAREDTVTAGIMLADCMRETMKLCYYMSNCYPPHDKWLFKGLEKLENEDQKLEELRMMLKNISEEASESGCGALVEKIADVLARALYEKGYTSDTEVYLDAHVQELLVKSALSGKKKAELVQKITELEFKAFDKVNNKGGRASCQDDWTTFSIMRRSQYLTWSRVMLMQYLYDFQREMDRGHNLIEEKYGRMMESTDPEEYEKIKNHFSVLSDEKKAIIEAVVGIQAGWMEEFVQKYPALAGNARSVHTFEDTLYNTSYETYLRGEISTYSDKMLELYGRYVADCAARGGNLAYEIMTNSVHMYGYPDLEKAQEMLSQ